MCRSEATLQAAVADLKSRTAERETDVVVNVNGGSGDWRVIGTVTVDSGGLVLVDPTYRTGDFYGHVEEEAALAEAVQSRYQAGALRTATGMVIGTMIAGASCDGDECLVEGKYLAGERGVPYLAEVKIRFTGQCSD